MMKDDPVVERVRAARHQIVAECGNDPHKLFEWAKRMEERYTSRLIRYEPSKRVPQNPGDHS